MKWLEIIKIATNFRHELHANPELTWHEKKTAKRIRQMLDFYNIPWRECATYGTVAKIAPEKNGKNIALRADIDALALDESTGLEYASQAKGVCMRVGMMGTLLHSWLRLCI